MKKYDKTTSDRRQRLESLRSAEKRSFRLRDDAEQKSKVANLEKLFRDDDTAWQQMLKSAHFGRINRRFPFGISCSSTSGGSSSSGLDSTSVNSDSSSGGSSNSSNVTVTAEAEGAGAGEQNDVEHNEAAAGGGDGGDESDSASQAGSLPVESTETVGSVVDSTGEKNAASAEGDVISQKPVDGDGSKDEDPESETSVGANSEEAVAEDLLSLRTRLQEVRAEIAQRQAALLENEVDDPVQLQMDPRYDTSGLFAELATLRKRIATIERDGAISAWEVKWKAEQSKVLELLQAIKREADALKAERRALKPQIKALEEAGSTFLQLKRKLDEGEATAEEAELASVKATEASLAGMKWPLSCFQIEKCAPF